jgi:hypothetical protein
MAAKLTVNKTAPTPSEQIVQDANRIYHVTDASGRQIGFRAMDMNRRRRTFKAMSAENQAKVQYMGMVMIAASVVEIDGEEIPLPTTELQFDFLIDRLDDHGFAAIGEGIKKYLRINLDADGVKKEAGE